MNTDQNYFTTDTRTHRNMLILSGWTAIKLDSYAIRVVEPNEIFLAILVFFSTAVRHMCIIEPFPNQLKFMQTTNSKGQVIQSYVLLFKLHSPISIIQGEEQTSIASLVHKTLFRLNGFLIKNGRVEAHCLV